MLRPSGESPGGLRGLVLISLRNIEKNGCEKSFSWDRCRQTFLKDQVSVVQRLDSSIHRINLYPVDSAISFPIIYPLDSDLSGG